MKDRKPHGALSMIRGLLFVRALEDHLAAEEVLENHLVVEEETADHHTPGRKRQDRSAICSEARTFSAWTSLMGT